MILIQIPNKLNNKHRGDTNDVNKENIPYKFQRSATTTGTTPINSLNIHLSQFTPANAATMATTTTSTNPTTSTTTSSIAGTTI